MAKNLKKKALENFRFYEKGVERLKELEKELDKIDTRKFRKEEKEIRKKLKNVSLIPEIESDIHQLRMKAAGLDTGYQKSLIDEKQDKKIVSLRRLESQQTAEIRYMEEKIHLLIKNFSEKAEELKKRISRAYASAHKKQLTREELENIIKIPELQKEIRDLGELFEDSSRILEADAEAMPKIRQKISLLRHFITKTVEHLQNGVENTKRQIGSIKKITEKLESEVAAEMAILPSLKRKLSSLNLGEKILEQEVSQEIQEIPQLEKKTNFLSRLLRKESKEIAQLENKVDFNRVDFNNRLLKELAESRRMIEEEKYVLRGQIEQAFMDVIKNLQEEKKESDRKMIQEIENLKQKIEEEKKDVRDSLISKIVQLRGGFERNKQDMYLEKEESEKKLIQEIESLKQKMDEEEKNSRESLISKIVQLRSKINQNKEELQSEKEEFEKKLIQEIENLKQKFEEDKKEENEGVISKIVQLRSRIDRGKIELHEETEKEFEDLQKEISRTERKEDLLKKELEQPVRKVVRVEIKPVELIKKNPVKIEFNKHKEKKEEARENLEKTAPKISFLKRLFMPKTNKDPNPIESTSLKSEEFKQDYFLPKRIEQERFILPADDFEMPAKIKKFMEESANEKTKIEKSDEKKLKFNAHKRIPQKKFVTSQNFNSLINELAELKQIFTKDSQIMGAQISEYREISSKEALKSIDNFENLRINLAKLASAFK